MEGTDDREQQLTQNDGNTKTASFLAESMLPISSQRKSANQMPSPPSVGDKKNSTIIRTPFGCSYNAILLVLLKPFFDAANAFFFVLLRPSFGDAITSSDSSVRTDQGLGREIGTI